MISHQRTRVMIVDDHAILRTGLQHVLEQTGEFEVVGQAADGEEAVRVAAQTMPSVIVMDVLMPGKDGVEACREIMAFAPETRVVMLTASTEEDAVIEAVAAGATGYLQKETGLEQLLSTVRDVARGELRVPAEVVKRVFSGIRGAPERPDPPERPLLTQREMEILTSFATGMSYAEIADVRGIQPVTVRNAIYGIQGKLKIESMQATVLWAVRNGLLDRYLTDNQGPASCMA